MGRAKVIVAVARNIVPQLFEVPALPDLPLRMGAHSAPVEKKRREVVAFVQKVGINAEF